VPANFHPDISKTVACGRVLKFKKNVILAPLRLRPEPRGSGAKNFLAYFFLAQGHDPYIFRSKSCKKFWGKFPQGSKGGATPKFLEKWMYPPRVMGMQISSNYISKTVGCWTLAENR